MRAGCLTCRGRAIISTAIGILLGSVRGLLEEAEDNGLIYFETVAMTLPSPVLLAQVSSAPYEPPLSAL